jgi:alpha-tubulin suppressor-like RCC1 family protein
VATGDNHTIVLTDFGDVLSFGRGREGQLGHGEKSDEAIPKIVNGLNHETVVDVACGSLTSYAITSSGRVYQW